MYNGAGISSIYDTHVNIRKYTYVYINKCRQLEEDN